jgi:hypothetical protein
MKICNALFLAAAMLFALGCNPPPPPLGLGHLEEAPRHLPHVDEQSAKLFQPVEGFAVVYIYRPRIFSPDHIVNLSIIINGKYIGFMKHGCFLRIVLPSGKYTIRGGMKHAFDEREINVETGQVYFLSVTYYSVNASPHVQLFSVRPDEAKDKILGLKMTDNPYNI